jgi:hypothetical protein
MGKQNSGTNDSDYVNGTDARDMSSGCSPRMASAMTAAGVAFEGGVRGGGVSYQETLPCQTTGSKKRGFDEHRRAAPASVHGVAGVEGIPARAGGDDGGHGASNVLTSEGHGCGFAGCGFTARSRHGLARHAHSRHGYGHLGKAMVK